MFSNNRGGDAPPPPYANEPSSPGETSLTSLLPTPAHRVECALVMLLCTDELRKSVTATFELSEELQAPVQSQSSGSEDLISFGTPKPEIDRSTYAKKQDRFIRKQELDTPEIQALKKASFAYFDTWRGKVLKRTCDALNVRADSVRLARKQHAAKVATIEKQRQHDDLVDWARTNTEDDSKTTELPSRYKAVPTTLIRLEKEKRALLLQCLVLLLLSLETYPAHSRILLLHISSSLQLPISTLVEHESKIAHGLLEAATQMSGEASRKAVAAENATTSKWKIGLATVAGAALIGVTGGLAAPLLAAGLGTVFTGLGLGAVTGLLGALAGNTLLIAGLFGAYGGNMTGKMMERYEKEVEDFKFLPIRCGRDDPKEKHQPLDSTPQRPPAVRTISSQRHKLRVTIGISGSLTTELDTIAPWSVLDSTSLEPFALRWEVAALLRLGVSLSSLLKSYAWQYAKWEIARRTLFGALAAGLWPLGLLKIARVVDNPFSVARVRADMAGKVLADALISKCQGERPVTLVGFSVGSRVIYSCLLELAARQSFGLIENVVLIGSPVPSDSAPWTKIRGVVSGRVINVYSTEDYILGFLYRASSAQFDVAGLQPVVDVNGVENFDVSDLVNGHTKYRYVVGRILQRVGIEDVDGEEVEKEIAILRAIEMEEATDEEGSTANNDAQVNVEDIERDIRARVGEERRGRVEERPRQNSRITMVDIDEVEERRREELLRAAEEKAKTEGDHPPAYDEYYGPSHSEHHGPTRRPQALKATATMPLPNSGDDPSPQTQQTTNDSAVKTSQLFDKDDGRSLIDKMQSLHIKPSNEVDDSDAESDVSIPRGFLSHVEPEPVDDYDEPEMDLSHPERPT